MCLPRRIFQIPRLGTKLKQDSTPLSYTPRKLISHPTNKFFYIIEGDHRVMGQDAYAQKLDAQVAVSSSRTKWPLICGAGSESKADRSTSKSLAYRQRASDDRKLQLERGHLASVSSIPCRFVSTIYGLLCPGLSSRRRERPCRLSLWIATRQPSRSQLSPFPHVGVNCTLLSAPQQTHSFPLNRVQVDFCARTHSRMTVQG
jgi:hypothetical protein